MFTRVGGAGRGRAGRRILLRAAIALCALAAGVGAAVALASSGGLDPTFALNGTTVLERPTDTYPVDDALSSGGRIVLLSTGEPGKITVQRLLPNGQPDLSFDGNGEAVIEEGAPGYPGAHALAVQPDGKIIVVGYRNVGSVEEAATVWRLDAEGGSSAPNGDLDHTFGSEGAVALKPAVDNAANAVAVQPDGKIVVAGEYYSGTGFQQVAVWRLGSDGSLDTTFNGSGLAVISDGHEDLAQAVALAPEGKVVVGGTSTFSGAPPDAVAWRLDANGTTDTSFDTDGQADIDTGGEDYVRAVAVQGDGKVVLGGDTNESGKPLKAMVWRMKPNGGALGNTNGALDPTFAHEGTAVLTGIGNAEVSALALQPDGKILAAGSTRGETGPWLAALWRLLPEGGAPSANGALDPTFGSGGITTVAHGEDSFVDSIALSPDRRIVASGPTFTGGILVFRAFGDPFTLRVARAGTGSGTVASSPGGIDCGAACSAPFDDGALLTLSASAAPGSVFAGWSGGECAGTGPCTVTETTEQTLTATFEPQPSQPVQTSTAPPARPASLGAPKLSFGKLKRGAKRFTVTVRGLPAGTKVTATLLAGHNVLARAKATVSAKGVAVLTFKFSKAARKRLHTRALHKLKLAVTAKRGALSAPRTTKTIKLAG